MSPRQIHEEIERIRAMWTTRAMDIETIYGVDEPSAKAINRCVSDLWRLAQDTKPIERAKP